MILLVLDTSGVDCSAALYDSEADRLIASRTERLGKGHAERLPGMVEEILAEAGMDLGRVDRIGVTVGPGSFTGIRTGVAAARGFALALGIPSVGVSTLAVLASHWTAENGARPVVAAIDAKRGEIYAQVFEANGQPAGEPQALDIEGFRDLVARHGGVVTGSAAGLLETPPRAGDADAFPVLALARLAAAAPVGEKPKPLYLRAPDAKPQAGFALART